MREKISNVEGVELRAGLFPGDLTEQCKQLISITFLWKQKGALIRFL